MRLDDTPKPSSRGILGGEGLPDNQSSAWSTAYTSSPRITTPATRSFRNSKGTGPRGTTISWVILAVLVCYPGIPGSFAMSSVLALIALIINKQKELLISIILQLHICHS